MFKPIREATGIGFILDWDSIPGLYLALTSAFFWEGEGKVVARMVACLSQWQKKKVRWVNFKNNINIQDTFQVYFHLQRVALSSYEH